MKKVVVIGGGTGTFTVLSAIRNYPVHLSVIVSMMDSGGSSGRLRDQFGVLPPGDLRQCLVALSGAPQLWRKLFLYRFQTGDLKGHNFGNLLLTALEMNCSSYNDVIKEASILLSTQGDVIPVTFDKCHLHVKYQDGKKLSTEGIIDKSKYTKSKIDLAYLKPEAEANPEALKAIEKADFIIIGPGDLYTSLIPNLLVREIPEAIQKSSAKVIYISNLMTKKGQTHNYKVSDHVKDIEKYLNKKVDMVLINDEEIKTSAKKYYESHGEYLVKDDFKKDTRCVRAPLISTQVFKKSKVDKAVRSLVRHDITKLGIALNAAMLKNGSFKEDLHDILSEAKQVLMG